MIVTSGDDDYDDDENDENDADEVDDVDVSRTWVVWTTVFDIHR